MNAIFNWVMNGFRHVERMPLSMKEYISKNNGVIPPNIRIKDYFQISPFLGDDGTGPQRLKNALLLGPVTVVLNGKAKPFVHYSSGIIDTKLCEPDRNHAVLAVGYGVEKGKKLGQADKEFVIIKNSWGKGWGEDGYARIVMKSEFSKGMCGIYYNNLIPFVDILKPKIAK